VNVGPGLQREIWRIADLNDGVTVLYRHVDPAQHGIGLYTIWGATDWQGAQNVKRLPIYNSDSLAAARSVKNCISLPLVGHVNAPRSSIEGNSLWIGRDGDARSNPVRMAVNYIQFLAY